jgi:hypothetical protein
MLTNEFEAKLLAKGFYFENPSLFVAGVDKDAEYYTAEQILDIIDHESTVSDPCGDFRELIRRRSEQTGFTSYYFKEDMGTEYFKVVVPNATGAQWLDLHAIHFTVKQVLDTIKVRLGMW